MYRYIKARFGQFMGVTALLIAFSAVTRASSLIEQHLIDAAMEQNLAGLRRYIPLALGWTCIQAVIYIIASVCRDVFRVALINDARIAAFDGILRRSRRDFEKKHSADYVSALTNDMSTIQGRYNLLFAGVVTVSLMIFTTVLMFYYQPLVSVCAILSALVMTIVPLVLGGVNAKWQEQRSRQLVALTALLSECFGGFETIVTFGIGRQIRSRFRECSKKLRDCDGHAAGLDAFTDSLAQLLSILAQTGILALSCWMVFTGRMTIGAMVVFTGLNSSFCSGLSTALTLVPMLKSAKPVTDRINELADYVDEEEQGDKEPSFRECVEVKNLGFGYDGDKAVLKHLSLTLCRGGKYALTGGSGSGKSTLIRLLLGDYPDYEGGIYYDGTELKELNRDRLHQVAACIHQDVFLFDDTIRNNICLFEEFSEEQFAWALKTSGVSKFTDTFPEGASYQVGERGERLSGGQKQRIAIARALIRNTDFLILDEGTSALDEQTAVEIENELLKMEDLTLLTITHHLHKPEEYNEVFTLSEGMLA